MSYGFSPWSMGKVESMDWREEYRDQGFVIVENVLSHSLIDTHLSDVAVLVRHYGVVDAATQAALPMPLDDELMAAIWTCTARAKLLAT